MKIMGVEIHHLAEDEQGNLTHAILSLTLSDGSHREIQIELPDPESAAKGVPR